MASSPPPTAQAAQPDVVAPALASTPNLALVSQVLGILSCIPAVGILFCIPAIVCGHLSLSRARATPGAQADGTRALWGLGLGYVIVVLYLWLAVGLFVAPMLSGR